MPVLSRRRPGVPVSPKAPPGIPEVDEPAADESGRWSLTVASRTTRAHGRRTIAKLLDAAVAEFGSYGYHGASMARIAKRAGTAHGTVYLHFADKDDLLYAAMTDVISDLEPALAAIPVLQPGPAGLEDLDQWLVRVCRTFQVHGAMLQAVSEALSADDRATAGSNLLESLGRNTLVFAERIRSVGASGIDPQIAALSFYALIEGANRTMFRGQLLVSTEELAASLAEFIQRSIFGAERV